MSVGLCTTRAVAQVDEARVTDRPTLNFDVACLCGDFLASHSQGYTLSDGTVKEPLFNHKGGICSGWCDQTCAAYRPVQLTRSNPAWQAVLAKATEVRMPEIFTGDLFRDWEKLCGDEPPEFGFVWGVRTTGTETLMLGADGALGWLRAIEHNGSHRNHRWYIWHGPVDQPGETLESVEFAEARAFLASRPAPGQRGV